MLATKISLIIAVVLGIFLYFVLSTSNFFVYFTIPSIIIVNVIRILEKKAGKISFQKGIIFLILNVALFLNKHISYFSCHE